MSVNKKQSTLTAKEELLNALSPFNINWIKNFTKTIAQTQMPQGKNANTENYILGLYISFILFENNTAQLMKHGELLRKYLKKYGAKVPDSHFSFVNDKFNEFLEKPNNAPALNK